MDTRARGPRVTAGTVRLTVPEEAEGSRLDQFLALHVPGRTRSALQRLIRNGLVTVDGETTSKPGLGLRSGMKVRVEIPEPPVHDLEPEDIPVKVIFEDEDLLVVDKPAGLVVHPGHGRRSGTLVHALLGRGTPLAPAGGRDRPGIVHRLDRETSGLVIVAKTDSAHRGLTRSFASREIEKRYHALVWGHPDPPAATVSKAIGRSRTDRTKMTVHASRGREATTRYRTLESHPGFAFLEVDLETGRTHQIRVHMQSIHHPVVGDQRYGGRAWKGLQDPVLRKAVREFPGLALHASRLAFPHPVRGKVVRVRAELPEEFRDLLRVVRGDR
jgi:23S rRNA pseudouridine1911/1915/1917 synthase